MKYINRKYSHGSSEKIGILITNLGTPDEPTKPALKRYLKEFLSDPRVVEYPRFLWWLVLNGVILQFRPAKSASAYQTVWTDEGSPLLTITKQQSHLLQARFEDPYIIEFAMRYGNPSLTAGIESLFKQGASKILVLPLYPQYCSATSASTFDAIAADFVRRRWQPDLRFISHYHDHDAYIRACVKRVQAFWEAKGKPDKLIFSYHGIPKRYLDNGDPYFCECHKTSRLIADGLGLAPNQYQMTFQSRFGREEWLKPYTDETLQSLAAAGTKNVHVFCPGFAADCLETIEEIDVENRDYFMQAGGETFEYIPALNTEQYHIDALAEIIHENLAGWKPKQPETELQSKLAADLGAKL